MGASFRILLYTSDEARAKSAFDAAFAKVADLDAKLSDYNPESELMRLCDRAGGPAVAVSDELFEILEKSIAVSRRSAGAFDVTVGPVVRLWRRARRSKTMPDPERLRSALEKVGYQKIVLDPKHKTVKLEMQGMRIDLGGIAKGYAASRALEVLEKRGIRSALVAAAGDIAVGAPPPGKDGWAIAIAPLEPGTPRSKILKLSHAAVSTAGDAEQYVVIDGKRYSHIINPHTGLGVIARASVTVVAADGATADSLDTTAFVLGMEKGIELIETTPGAAGLFVVKEPGGIQERTTKAFDKIPLADWSAAEEVVPLIRKQAIEQPMPSRKEQE